MVKRLNRTEPFAFYNNFTRTFGQRRERSIANVCNRVAESVDVGDLAFDPIRGGLRFRPVQFHKFPYRAPDLPKRQTLAQVRSDRRKDIASVKGVADRAQKELLV